MENIYLFEWYFTLSYNTYCENCQIKGSLNRESICLNSRANVAYIYDGPSLMGLINIVLTHITFILRTEHRQSTAKKICYSKERLNKSNFSYKLREGLKFIISSNFFFI